MARNDLRARIASSILHSALFMRKSLDVEIFKPEKFEMLDKLTRLLGVFYEQ